MAPTPSLTTGFETGLAGVHGTVVGAGPAVVAGAARNGSYGLRITATANVAHRLQISFPVGVSKLVGRIAVKASSRPSSGTAKLVHISGIMTFTIDSTGVIGGQYAAGTVQNGPTLDTTSFHVIEWQYEGAAGTLDWKVDGVQQTRATGTAAGSPSLINLGTDSTVQPAFTADYDDLILGTWVTAGTDWFGDGKTLGYTVTSDGTHSFTANDFSTGDAGTVRASSYTLFFDMVDDATPWTTVRSTTDNIAQRVIRTTGYVELIVGGATEATSANTVQALMAYSASGTAADTAGTIIRNSGGTAKVVFGDLPVAQGGLGGALADYSESTNFFKTSFALTAPAAGWTATEVNSLRFRFGGSDDQNPIPTLQLVMVEADWPILPPLEAIVMTAQRAPGWNYYR